MITPRQWIISQKYGKKGAQQIQSQKTKGPQISPLNAKGGKKIKYPRPHELTEAELKKIYPGQFRNESNAPAPKKHTKGRAHGGIITDGYLAGGLLTKGVKTAYKLAKKKYPSLFTAKALSMIRGTKTHQYSQLKQLGFAKGLKAKDLRKMSVSEVLKERLEKLKRLSITHHGKAAKIVKSKMITPWKGGKAKALFKPHQYKNISKYDRTSTQKKLDALRKSQGDLSVYQQTIRAKTATKHALGGLIIGKNVDKELL